MNKEKYNQLRKEIIRICPDIVELKFGCRVVSQVKDATQTFNNTLIGCKIIGANCYPTVSNGSVHEDRIIEIIGRSITLEDCLIAFEPKWSWTEAQKLYRLWQLNKPLQKQDDETINFLHSLICNNE